MEAQASVDGARIAPDALNRGVDGCKRTPAPQRELVLGRSGAWRASFFREASHPCGSPITQSLLTAGWGNAKVAAAAVIEPLSTMRTKGSEADVMSMRITIS